MRNLKMCFAAVGLLLCTAISSSYLPFDMSISKELADERLQVDHLQEEKPASGISPLAFATFQKEIIPIDMQIGVGWQSISLEFAAMIQAISPDCKSLYVTDRNSDELYKVDATTGTASKIESPIGSLGHLAVCSNSQIAYACYEKDIFKFDFEKKTHQTLIRCPESPENLILDPTETHLYVFLKAAQQLQCYNLKTNSLETTLALNTFPDVLALSGEKIYLLELETQTLTTVDIASQDVETEYRVQCPLKKPVRLKFGIYSKDHVIYFCEERANEIFKLDLRTLIVEKVIALIPMAESISFCKEQALVAKFELSHISGRCISFDASTTKSIGTGKIDYLWSFGDGFEEFTEEPFAHHIYESAGEYTAGLTVAQTIALPAWKSHMGYTTVDSGQFFSSSRTSVCIVQDTSLAEDKELFTKAPSAATATQLSSNINPSFFGQTILLTATIAPQVSNAVVPTGTVNFMDGSTLLGSSPVLGGVATLSIATLSAASHSITAIYSGDSFYLASLSDATNQVVTKANTALQVTSSANPATFQQPVVLTATLSIINGSGSPTGTITFMEGATTLGTVPLNGFTATLSLADFSVGIHPITAIYSGNGSFQASTSAVFNQVINTSTTTSTLISSPSTSVFGQSILLRAMIAPANTGSKAPTGTVTFMDGASNLGTSSIVNGTAILSTKALSVATHSLTAIYNGDENFTTSTSNAVSQVVTKATTAVALTSSVNPSVFGNATLLTATLSVTSGAGTPTGSVTFKNGTTTIGTATVSGNVATLSISNLSVGVNAITASYGGDTNFLASVSNTTNQTVNQGTTQSTLTTSIQTTTYGQSTTLTATVDVTTGTGMPTGYFTFMDGSLTLGTVNLTGLSAALNLANLSVGAHSIIAIYSGDTNFQTSTSTPALLQTVDKATPLIALTAVPTASNYADTITFTTTVTAPTTLGLPSGTITFFDGAVLIGSAPLTGTETNTSTASINIKTLPGGSHAIKATYSGDTNFTTVTSAPPLLYTITPLTTTTTLFLSSVNATEFGQPVLLIANVTGSVAAPPLAPSGTVSFYDGTALIGTSTLGLLSANTSTATLTYPSFSVGPHTLSAVYSSDTNYNGSTSSNLVHRVIQASTSSTVTTSETPSVYGQTLTFTSRVVPNSPGKGIPSGTVNFYEGTTLLGTSALVPEVNASQATLSFSNLTLGSHFIYTTYAGDDSFTSSISSALTQVVKQAATTTTFSSSLPISNFGELITWTANVVAVVPGAGIPTGSVTFYNGSAIMGTGLLNSSGVATFASFKLFPGNYSLQAVYNGDSNFLTSASQSFNQVVNNQLDTLTTVTASRNASPINQSVSYSAKVTAKTGIPTGTVNFYDDGIFIGSAALNSSGIATISDLGARLNLAPATHPITATYTGDSHFLSSTSAIYNEYIVPYDTALALTSVPNHSKQAGALLTATVTASPAPAPLLNGTVTFYENGVAISPPLSVPSTGIVTFQPNNLHFNSQMITAVYSGDLTTFATATSNVINQQVQQTDMLTTNTVVSSLQSTTYYCQPISLSATVTQLQGFYTPTGTVTFYDGTRALGSALLNDAGVATLSVSTLAIGKHAILATYDSDSNYAFSTSNTIQQTVLLNPTTTTLAFIPNTPSSPYGQNLILTAKVTAAYSVPTGHIIFADNGTTLATVDLDSKGMAIYSTQELTGGQHTITATYSSSCCSFEGGCFDGSADSKAHAINHVNPSLTLKATPSPGTYGNTIRLNATIAANSYGTPTGSVSFYQGSTFLGTSPISQGVANLTVSGVNAGLNLFNASYSGDSNFLTTNFPSYLEIVNKANVTVALTNFSSNPAQYGEDVILNAHVNSPISAPTGTVAFYWGSVLLSTVNLDSSGYATLKLSTLPVGNNNLSAVYSGDFNFNAATSPTTTQTISKSNTLTIITSGAASTFNSPTTFNVIVTGVLPGADAPTGTITGYLGDISLGTATLNGGSAFFTTSILPSGTETVRVVYSGDGNFLTSEGLTTQTINQATTTISSLTSSSTPSSFGQTVTLSATVSSKAGIPAGLVSFYDGTTQLGVAMLNSSGTAALSTAALSVATHAITAVYSGSDNFSTASSSTLNQVVNKASTTILLTSNVATAVYGQAVAFTATVNPVSPGAGNPAGTVTFRNGSTTLGTASLNSGGTASFTTTSLAASSTPYAITAVYTGNASFNTSTSASLAQAVNPVSTLINAISSANPSTIGQSVTFNVTVNAINTGTVTPTGTVTANYGSTVVGTGSLNAAGQISFTTSSLPAGTLPIIFTYAGNSNFSGTSSTLDQTIQAATTTTILTSSLTPSYFGQRIVLTATTTTATGTASGTVSFFDGNALIGTQILTGGTATLAVANLAIGNHSLTAVYSGDSSRMDSTSAPLSQVVQKATTSLSVNSSVNPSAFGQNTIFTATVLVNQGSGTPTGTVNFYNNGTLIGTRGLNGNLSTLDFSTLTPGVYAITATYSGDANFTSSTSPSFTQTVTTASTTTTLTALPNPAPLGAAVILTANVHPALTASNLSGSVTFKDGTAVLGSVPLSNSQAILTISTLTLGTHTITATYNGDVNYSASSSSALSQVITEGLTTTSLSSDANPSAFGQLINLKATVTASSASIPATGVVTFFDGSISMGSSALNNGIATLATSTLSVASHSLKAVYSGDTNYAASTSLPQLQIVTPSGTNTHISSSANPVIFGAPVTFVATVTSQTGTGTPTGLVSFREGPTILGSAPLDNGIATFTTSALSSGGHSISAIYLGTPNFLTSTSAAFVQIIAEGTAAVELVSSPNPASFGQQVVLTATVSTESGLPTGTVSFFDGSTTIGEASVKEGVATLSISDMSVNVHTLSAVYNGSDNYASATSAPLSQTITQATSITRILSATPNPSMLGQNVTFFATVSTGKIDATGSVSFFDGQTLLGTVSLSQGIAIYDTPLLSLGAHAISATFNGDANFSPSTSLSLYQNVNQANVTLTTAVSLTSNLNPSVYGDTVLFDVHVSPITGTGVPTGVVTLYSGAMPLVTLSLLDGSASYSTADLPAGNLAIVALYSGDSNFSASTTTLSQIVSQIETTTKISSSAINAMALQPITFTAEVTSANAIIPSGIVSFYDGTSLLGTALLNELGQASLTTAALTPGTHSVSASYTSFQNFANSSATLNQTIIQAATSSIILSALPNPSQLGSPVVFTAAVTALIGTPAGSVSFYEGTVLLGSEPLYNGLAVLNISSLSPGSHVITVAYDGSVNFAPSTSANYIQKVLPQLFATTTTLTSAINPTYAGADSMIAISVTSEAAGRPAGSVSIYDGTTLIGTQILVDGQASINFSSTAVGQHALTAVYSGNSTFAPSTSIALLQSVQAATTTIQLASSNNPSQYGQTILLTADLSINHGLGTPRGNVKIYDGTQLLDSMQILDSRAVFTISNLSPGSHALTAIYSGDSTFEGSTSLALMQSILPAETSIALTSSLNPAPLNALVTFIATLYSKESSQVATGGVSFYDGETLLGTSALNGNTATFSTDRLSLGTHSIKARYQGDIYFAPSTTASLAQVINQGATTTTLSSNITPSQVGQSIVLTATIDTAAQPATGSVAFYDGPLLIGSAPLIESTANLSISSLSAGAHFLSAVYSGDNTYAPSTSPLFIQYVTFAATTTEISTSDALVVYGQQVTFTAAVKAQASTIIPAGYISFRDGSTVLGSVDLNEGVASFTTSKLLPGVHAISAVYIGDAQASASAPIDQIVQQAPTDTQLTSSLNPSTFGREILLTATVTAASGSVTGFVTFMDGSTALATVCLCNGKATFSTADLSIGQHTLTAIYSGSIGFIGSTSPLLNQIVETLTSTVNILSAAPNPSMLGQNVVFFAAVSASAGNPTGTVSFYDGQTLLGSETIYEGLAIFEINTLPVGNHSITARYSGDVHYTAAESPVVIQSVNQNQITVTSVTTLTSNLNPSTYGQDVTFGINVLPLTGGGMPTGVVTLYSGSVPLVTLNLVNGKASYTTDDLPAGTWMLVALYSGDSAYSSSSGTLSQTILPIASSTVLQAAPVQALLFQPVTFTATVSAAEGQPLGTVSFYDGQELLGTSSLDSKGQASLTTADLTSGKHLIKAVYNGAKNYQSSFDSLDQDIYAALTTTTIMLASPNPSNINEEVTFLATVSSQAAMPTGSVTFYDGDISIGSGTLVNGLAVFKIAFSTPGKHFIKAVYAGAASYSASTSANYIQVVKPDAFIPHISLKSSKNPAELGMSVTFKAKVSAKKGSPTGSVTFYNGSVSLGTALLVKGVAKLTTELLPVGKHTILAIYSGDSAYASVSSASLTQVIKSSTTPPPPHNFYGCQRIDKYINTNRIVNVLMWTPPETHIDIAHYEIYCNAELTDLIGIAKNQCPYQFEDGNAQETQAYYIVSVSANGVRSKAAFAKIGSKKK